MHLWDDVSNAELITLYSAAELFILLSYYEGFGLPILEAMACETPVIVADRARYQRSRGHAVVLVDPDDETGVAHAIYCTLTDNDLNKELIQAGCEQTKVYSCKERRMKL